MSNQISSIDLEEEVMSDPVAVAFVYDYNIRIEVRPDNCDQQYEVALFDSDEDSVIRRHHMSTFSQ